MTYALIKNGAVTEYPVYEGEIRLRFPGTSFPIPFEPPADYEPVADVQQPEIDHTKNVADGTPELVDGVWTRKWIITDATSEQLAERTSAKAQEVRGERNRLLAACDWTQLADAPVDAAEWAVYRQALRDLSGQPDFPWEVTWPEQL
jgi:hypothetical protein